MKEINIDLTKHKNFNTEIIMETLKEMIISIVENKKCPELGTELKGIAPDNIKSVRMSTLGIITFEFEEV